MASVRLTIKDIARLAGVSNATVSRVVNNRDAGVGDDTRERIKAIIRENGYRTNVIAKSMITRRTNSIGLIVPDVSNPFFSDIAKSVEATAEAKGYTLFLCNTDNSLERERRYIGVLADRGVDGIILAPASIGTHSPEDQEFAMPAVLIGRPLSARQVGVFVDNAHGSYVVTESLIHAGHRRMAFIGGPPSDRDVINRFDGFTKACAENGVEVRASNCYFGEFSVQTGIAHAEKIAATGASACVCANDLIALGLISGLKKLGASVPEDLSVTGFDDILLSEISIPSITTMRQPTNEIGALATSILVDLVEGNPVTPGNRILPTELVVRASTRSIY